ncbi:MAG TPA: hypothetical protein VN493_01515 [Thermoanaerobaculia bacterium]|nr:hypothetical protein [Thermoanaerobaculia bacterium]
MAGTWTPEQLGVFEAKVEAARAGDVGEAASLLRWVAKCLENGWPLPEPLRCYLINAFRKITKDDNPGGLLIPPQPVFRNVAELSKIIKHLETYDANAALNLKPPPGRKHTRMKTAAVSLVLDMMVGHEMEGGKRLTQAIEAVADKMDVSDKTVSRARKYAKRLRDNK